MENRFRSRISVLLIFVLLLSLLPIFLSLSGEGSTEEIYLGVCIAIGTIVIVVGILVGVQYEITSNELIVKIGPFNYGRIKINNIEKIERSYNPLSSPASSLKRLMVSSKTNNFLISPVREKEFVAMMHSRNPNISVKIDDTFAWYRIWDWDI